MRATRSPSRSGNDQRKKTAYKFDSVNQTSRADGSKRTGWILRVGTDDYSTVDPHPDENRGRSVTRTKQEPVVDSFASFFLYVWLGLQALRLRNRVVHGNEPEF